MTHLGTRKPLSSGVTVLSSSKEAIKLANPVSEVLRLDLIGPRQYAPKCLITPLIVRSAGSATDIARREGKKGLTSRVRANTHKPA